MIRPLARHAVMLGTAIAFGWPLAVHAHSDSRAHGAAHNAAVQPHSTVPLYDNLGNHHYPITTGTPQAQRYFNQGLRLYYAFNHQEAIRAFEEAARLDPTCAMAQWGIALALGPNINAPMDAAAARAAYAAIRKAVADLKSGDVLLIAGKGHETGQIVGDRILPFSDHDAVAAALQDRVA